MGRNFQKFSKKRRFDNILIGLKNNRITELRILKTAIILPHFPQAFTEQQPLVRRFGFLVVGCQLSVVGSFTQLDFTEQLPSVLFKRWGCNFAEWFLVVSFWLMAVTFGMVCPPRHCERRYEARQSLL
ncbi:hypothetical protein ACLI08_02595 [Flavobacterium sp. RNTU_13]|uniref:hypothetical protein n=1 Tax=Flavobacterium sp. RNTU_13 TaxID=3375145 RepID=UPI003985EABD